MTKRKRAVRRSTPQLVELARQLFALGEREAFSKCCRAARRALDTSGASAALDGVYIRATASASATMTLTPRATDAIDEDLVDGAAVRELRVRVFFPFLSGHLGRSEHFSRERVDVRHGISREREFDSR